MQLNLNGKVALVTASSGGIGLAIASSLAAEGAKVAVNGRTKQSVDKALASIRAALPEADLIPLVADNGTAAGCEKTIAELPSVDILVNNLGIYEAVGFFDETDADWLLLFEVNIMSGVRLSRHYLRGMIERNEGRIVFISSESAISPAPEMTHYSATKYHAARHLPRPCRAHQEHAGNGERRASRLDAYRKRGSVCTGCLSRRFARRSRAALHRRESPDLSYRPPDRSERDR
jgi:NADP-dependent 3-hydroxy acid dehydrogenase YdfG